MGQNGVELMTLVATSGDQFPIFGGHMITELHPGQLEDPNAEIRDLLQLPDHLMDAILRNQRSLSRYEHVYRRGDQCDELYVVLSGWLKAYVLTMDGDEEVVSFHFPGHLFGTDGFIANKRAVSVLALEKAVVCPVSIRGLQRLMEEDDCLRHRWIQLLSKMIREEHHVTDMLRRNNAEQRVAAFLLYLRDQRHPPCPKVKAYCRIRVPMTRRDMANYLGLSMETVSRAFTRLQDKGILHTLREDLEISNAL